MGTNATNPQGSPQVDLASVQNEINGLSNEQIKAELLKIRVRQKKQQKKMQGSASQKTYQLRQREKIKMLKAKAKEMGIYDSINDEAERLAEEELAADNVAGQNEEEEEVTA